MQSDLRERAGSSRFRVRINPRVSSTERERWHDTLWEGQTDQRFQQMDMPFSTREDPSGWVFRTERYFLFYRMMNSEKIQVAEMAMKGDALAWYRWQDVHCPFYSWNELKTHLLKHLRLSSDEALQESFLVKRQEDTMADYRRQFKVLAKPGKEISNSVLERVVITKLEVDKEQVVGSSSRLLQAQTTDVSD